MPGPDDLRVLHIITRLIVGGAQENTLFTAIGQHNTKGMRVTLLAGIDDGPEGNLHDRAHQAGLDLQLMRELVRPIAPTTDAVAFARLCAFIRRGRYDVVHTHSSKAGILGRIAARAVGTPIIVHTLHSLVFGEHAAPWKNALYVRLKKLCAPMTHKIISVCDATKDGAIAAGIGTLEQHLTIYSGFHIEPFLRVRDALPVAEAKRRLGLAPEHLVVGKVARLFPQKGHDHFLAAARLIAAREPRARFLLVGDGILRADLEAQTRQWGIRDRFVFAGLVAPPDVPAHIQAMDVAVHTSIREGLARVIPQASAVGKPVVAFALDGTPEAISHGVSGFLTTPYDAPEVADRVLEILDDAPRKRAMGEAGRAFAGANFPVEVMVRRVNEVYHQLAAQHLDHRHAA
ncbi:MAG: glycosyltransferase family 1 protein [Myxococcales bacterium]|nr:glycosyltransferase family 1 protein [Myxococcales bacterium]